MGHPDLEITRLHIMQATFTMPLAIIWNASMSEDEMSMEFIPSSEFSVPKDLSSCICKNDLISWLQKYSKGGSLYD